MTSLSDVDSSFTRSSKRKKRVSKASRQVRYINKLRHAIQWLQEDYPSVDTIVIKAVYEHGGKQDYLLFRSPNHTNALLLLHAHNTPLSQDKRGNKYFRANIDYEYMFTKRRDFYSAATATNAFYTPYELLLPIDELFYYLFKSTLDYTKFTVYVGSVAPSSYAYQILTTTQPESVPIMGIWRVVGIR